MATRRVVTGVLAALILTGINVNARAEVLLRITGDAGLQGHRMYLDGAFVGIVGDRVPVSVFHHGFGIEVQDGLLQTYDLALKDGRIEINAIPLTECWRGTAWRVSPKGAPDVQRSRGEVSIALSSSQPEFEGICSSDLPNVPCQKREADVYIRSVPEVNAEVSLEGISLGTVTAAVIHVPYCAGITPALDFELRKSGYTPCKANLELRSELTAYDLTCALQRETELQAAAWLPRSAR